MIQNSVDVWISDAEERPQLNERWSEYSQNHHHGGETVVGEILDSQQDVATVDLRQRNETDRQEISSQSHAPDFLVLAELCSQAHPPVNDTEKAFLEAHASWDAVRDWMRSHSADEIQAAAEQQDESGKTALHMTCQNAPPNDVIDVFFSISQDIVKWPDIFGWLPIHYASAYSASHYVVKALAESYPKSKTVVDRQGRTPLHCALGYSKSPTAALVQILADSGAAACPDSNGMLPIHYACAYGAAEDCLFVLTDAYRKGIRHLDKRARTPLHFSLSNAARPAASSAVRLLLRLNPDLVNSRQGSPSPFKVLAEFAATIPYEQKEERESCKACLKHLLAARPTPTPDFFTALQSLPAFLQEMAVVIQGVQELLNAKIAQRICTLILMLDFYVQIAIVSFFSIAIIESVDLRFEENTKDAPIVNKNLLYPLFCGASYFFLREVVNFLSLLSLGALRSWAREPSTWLNLLYIFVICFWTIHMYQGTLDAESFRTGAAISVIVIWTKFLSYLRNMLIAFAVFTGGVFHVMRRLAAFLICLIIILIAFSRMFFTLFRQSDYCILDNPAISWTEESVIRDLQCEQHENHPWCNSWDSFLAVYTFLLGGVNESKFKENSVAVALFALFMFLVVILLGNVLIAIVTDSYKIIQDQRSAIVFWTNRLNYIAQMDAIVNGPWKRMMYKALGMKESVSFDIANTFGKHQWDVLMNFLNYEIESSFFSLGYLLATLMRAIALVCIIPAWVVLGVCTAGLLWPPQVREYVFTSVVSRHNSESEKEEELRSTQLIKLRAEIVSLGEDLRQELALDRAQIVQTKSLVAHRKLDIQAEMKEIKRVIAMLFEQTAG